MFIVAPFKWGIIQTPIHRNGDEPETQHWERKAVATEATLTCLRNAVLRGKPGARRQILRIHISYIPKGARLIMGVSRGGSSDSREEA